MAIKLYNTATRKKEEFKPLKKDSVGIYSCGPTVYWNQHIGHMYAYTQWDVLVRFLKYMGYKVKWVMNITDVGHLTSDEDTGQDKMEKGAEREGLTVEEIANKYTNQFKESLKDLNITSPDVLPQATEHIEEQIKLNKEIEAKGFAYQTSSGLFFDTSKFPDYPKFARLNLDKQKEGARVEIDPEKKNPADFALWFTNQPNHILKWDSPWGVGFPGWHIECTAMSTKHLGNQFDIHTGGKEHIPAHHSNEIAQAHAVFGNQTANYWIHNGMLNLKGTKISKSDPSTIILVSDLKDKGYNPLSLRYLIMTSHYGQGLEFSYQSLDSAQTALNRLYETARNLSKDGENNPKKVEKYKDEFISSLSDDLNIAKGLATLWNMIKDKELSGSDKLNLLLDWDKVLGFKIEENLVVEAIPEEIEKIAKEREIARQEKDWKKSDSLRDEIEEKGYSIKDTLKGQEIFKNN